MCLRLFHGVASPCAEYNTASTISELFYITVSNRVTEVQQRIISQGVVLAGCSLALSCLSDSVALGEDLRKIIFGKTLDVLTCLLNKGGNKNLLDDMSPTCQLS